MFQVTLENNDQTFYLRGTTWAFQKDRGNEFASEADAVAAIVKASKFMPKKLYKSIKIVEA